MGYGPSYNPTTLWKSNMAMENPLWIENHLDTNGPSSIAMFDELYNTDPTFLWGYKPLARWGEPARNIPPSEFDPVGSVNHPITHYHPTNQGWQALDKSRIGGATELLAPYVAFGAFQYMYMYICIHI